MKIMTNKEIQVTNETTPRPIRERSGEGPIAAIKKYFKDLSDKQQSQFAMLDELYHDWNAKINVISRKDIDNLYEHHVLHSLAIAQYINFRPEAKVMDLGTGGGFPGIPLAIMFPETHFHLVDSTKKKILVCDEVVKALGLTNVTTRWCRAEEEKEKFDFVVSRAVMPLADLVKICHKNIAKESKHALPNGLICLKGGEDEAFSMKKNIEIVPISDYFNEEFFETKKIVYVQL